MTSVMRGRGVPVPASHGTEIADLLAVAIMSAMWNHASAMEQALRKHGFPWPRLEPGDAADLTAFLLMRRAPEGSGTAAAKK